MPLIFQYGSNCDADRLRKRLGNIDDLGRAQTIGEYEIAFDIWSQGNCCAAADLVLAPGSGRHAWGVLYEMPDAALAELRKVEGWKYEERSVHVRNEAGEELDATTFLVKEQDRRRGLWTSAEYLRHIVKGFRNHGVGEVDPDYVHHIIDIATRTNQEAIDKKAASEQATGIERLRRRESTL